MAKTLVAYFSASGVTEQIAKALAEKVEGDLFEIQPETPYTKEDLDWTNPNSRSSVEMNDPTNRPAIAKKVENFEDYDIFYVGFPIWWYVEPTIIDTFLESYDFTGKTIIPFATSGGSGIEKAAAKMPNHCAASFQKSWLFKSVDTVKNASL